jgi:hypothetical protein
MRTECHNAQILGTRISQTGSGPDLHYEINLVEHHLPRAAIRSPRLSEDADPPPTPRAHTGSPLRAHHQSLHPARDLRLGTWDFAPPPWPPSRPRESSHKPFLPPRIAVGTLPDRNLTRSDLRRSRIANGILPCDNFARSDPGGENHSASAERKKV